MACPADKSFGPVVVGCRQNFDFTLLFEETIFTLVPSVLLLFVGPVRLQSLLKKPPKTRRTWTRILKLALCVSFAALQLAFLITWAACFPQKTRASMATALVSFSAALIVLDLSYQEDTRAIRPSTILTVYLVASSFLDAVQVRTLFLRKNGLLAALLCASVINRLVLAIIESRSKISSLKAPYNSLPTESLVGTIQTTCLSWLNGFFKLCYTRDIRYDNLPRIDPAISIEQTFPQFEAVWSRESHRPSPSWLFWSLQRGLYPQFIAIVIPRLALIGFRFAQPFLISTVLSAITNEDCDRNKIYGLIGATFIIYFGIAVSNVRYLKSLYRFVTITRGILITLIYNKSLVIDSTEVDRAASITLMSTDVDRFSPSVEEFHDIWASSLEAIIAIVLLALQLGWFCIVPLVVAAVSYAAEHFISCRIGASNKVWRNSTQARVSATRNMLGSMKSIKLTGLSNIVMNIIQELRRKETRLQGKYRWFSVMLNAIAEMPAILAPALTFSAYALKAKLTNGQPFDLQTAFTSLSIINLMMSPIAVVFASIPTFSSTWSNLEAITDFLRSPERQEVRSLPSGSQGSGIGENQDANILSTASDHEIVVHQVSVRPVLTAPMVLNEVSLEIPKRSVTMISGPTGCGKSTLLKVLLGEIAPVNGEVFVRKQALSYCPQDSWLASGTIKKNICGPADTTTFDASWYKRIIKICALDVDFQRLPLVDETHISSNGSPLSGGQQQRVSLARALYARNKLFILDDVFSALDGDTGSKVFDNLFGRGGLFKELGTTVILVTSNPSHFVRADSIVSLSSDGRVLRQGPLDNNSAIASTLRLIGTTASQVKNDGVQTSVTETVAELPQSDQADEHLDLSEERRLGGYKVYKYYLRIVGCWRAALCIGLNCLAILAFSLQQEWLNLWASDAQSSIAMRISIYVILSFVQLLTTGAAYWAILVLIAPVAARRLHYNLLKTVMDAPQAFHDKAKPGTLLNRFSQDMTLVESVLPVGILLALYNACLVIVQAGFVVSGSYFMIPALVLLVVSLFILQRIYLRTSRQLQYLDLESRDPLYAHFGETLDGNTVLRAFVWQEHCQNENRRITEISQRPYYLMNCIQPWLNFVLSLIVTALAVLVVGLALGLRQSTQAGLLGIALNNILSLSSSMQVFLQGWVRLETAIVAIGRVRELELTTESEHRARESDQVEFDWVQQGSIEIKNLTVGYSPGQPIFENLSFSIAAGRKMGICGRTGSGKSTLLSALLHLLDPTHGDIIIDGRSILNMSRHTLRQGLLVLPQNPYILDVSLRTNIDPSGEYSDASIVEVLRKVQMWPNPLLNRVAHRSSSDEHTGASNGHTQNPSLGESDIELNDLGLNENDENMTVAALETPIEASRFSEGQKQLLALARAILNKSKSKILLLDEATSSLDMETDRLIQRLVRVEFPSHTILSIAHRLDTVSDFDEIIMFDHGKIIGCGTPAQILATDAPFASDG